MITTSAPSHVAHSTESDTVQFDVRVRNRSLRSHVHNVLDAQPRSTSPSRTLRISDFSTSSDRADILVTHPAPLACRAAHRAVCSGHARAAIALPEDGRWLTTVASALRMPFTVISDRVAERAAVAVSLTEREIGVALGLVRGESHRMIAAQLHVSEATIKRDVAEIKRQAGLRTSRDVLLFAYALAGDDPWAGPRGRAEGDR